MEAPNPEIEVPASCEQTSPAWRAKD